MRAYTDQVVQAFTEHPDFYNYFTFSSKQLKDYKQFLQKFCEKLTVQFLAKPVTQGNLLKLKMTYLNSANEFGLVQKIFSQIPKDIGWPMQFINEQTKCLHFAVRAINSLLEETNEFFPGLEEITMDNEPISSLLVRCPEMIYKFPQTDVLKKGFQKD